MTTIAQFKGVAQADPPLRAPYNFVPLNVKVLPSPWPEGPDHGAPHELGLCGELAVEWRLETPLLVGGHDNNSPFQFGEGGPYAIPGASLRGMIRAVLEILSYAHLGAYDDQRFSVRDYDAETWKNVMTATSGPGITSPKAGWLSKNTKENTYHLTPCEQIDVPIAGLAGALGMSKVCWDCTSLHNRHALLAANGLSKEIDLGRIDPELAGKRGTLVVAGLIKSEVQRLAGGGGQETNKAKEVAFLETPGARSWPISQAAFEAFEAVQVKDGNDHPSPPEENWSFWKPKLEKGVRIPVFYRGDPRTAAGRVPAPTEFVMALTKLMRFPHTYTTAVVTRRSQPPLQPSQLDFVEALFGRVPDEDDDNKVTKPQGRQRAWRSRVRFGMATLAENKQASLLEARQAVTMRPRPSFYPFYLRPNPKATGVMHPVDWSSPQAHLAGRKRYPPRNQVTALPPAEREAPRPGRAEPPVQADAGGVHGETRELENSLRFLDASPERPLVFRSTIRFHNLLPVELGGLIWAIGLRNPGGNEDRPLRHMLGRAKAFGYGQLQAQILENDSAFRIKANTGGDGEPSAAYADAFEKWVVDGLKSRAPFTALPEVAALLALCDARLGAELSDALAFPRSRPSGKLTEAELILKAYSTIRKRSACQWADGHTDRRAGSPVSDDRGDANRLLLPEYPLCREAGP